MQKVASKAIQLPYAFSAGSEVGRIEYQHGLLRIRVDDVGQDLHVIVEFAEARGFRVLDERDLMEYWPACSVQNGCLYEIHASGWLQQESGRAGSSLVHMQPDTREFLVAGINECVSVFSSTPPSVHQQASNPASQPNVFGIG